MRLELCVAVVIAAVVFPALVPGMVGHTLPTYGTVGDPAGRPAARSWASDANPFSSGMPASLVLGQPNLTDDALPSRTSASSVGSDYGLAFDAMGDLWVAEWSANRVLEFRPPFTTDMNAVLVLGQSTFVGNDSGSGAANLSDPDGLAFDSEGDLWVSDFGNNRVVEFTAPFTDGESASRVVGQSTFGVSTYGHGPGNLSGPAGIAFDGPDLWVCDFENDRVLEFASPLDSGEPASGVLGQSTLSGDLPATTARNLSGPSWISFDSAGNAWVADSGNNRVVMFPAPLSRGEAAAVVLGQSDLTERAGGFPASLSSPEAAVIDGRGDVWVADTGHNRVLEYAGPTATISSNATPAIVLGQPDLSSLGANATPTGMRAPAVALLDSTGDLWASDFGDRRVLEYVPSSYDVALTESGLPSGTNWTVTLGGAAQSSVGPTIVFDETNGSYEFRLGPISGFRSPNETGEISVNGTAVGVAIEFASVEFNVTITEVGLPVGTAWNVTVASTVYVSRTAAVVFGAANGSYAFRVAPVPGFSLTHGQGTLDVNGAPTGIEVTFTANVTQTGSSAPATAGLLDSGWISWALLGSVVGAALAAGVVWARRPRIRRPPDGGSVLPPGPGEGAS